MHKKFYNILSIMLWLFFNLAQASYAQTVELDHGGGRTTPAAVVFPERAVDFSIPPMAEASFDEETGGLVIYDADGAPHSVPAEKNADGESIFPMIVTDRDGNRYMVEVPGETPVPGAGEGDAQRKAILTEIENLQGSFDASRLSTSSPVTVRFLRGEGRYAFDDGAESRYQRPVMLARYYAPFGPDYVAPWKLIPTGESDVVEAFAVENGKAFDRGKIRFALKDGAVIPARDDGGKWTLQLPGMGKGETCEVFALYETGKNKHAAVGKLNVVSYPEQRHTATLVEVDGQMPRAERLQEELNAIYGPYGRRPERRRRLGH